MSKQSRREFLERSMFAAAAALGGTTVPQRLFAQASKSPNETLRVAVLGVRSRGQSHIGGFLGLEGCEIVAIVDPDEAIGQRKGVERIEKETGKTPAFYKDLRNALEDNSIDVVTIATPNHWHALAAILAIQAGKDVYVEKPVSHNVSEGRRIVQAARYHKRIVQTGTQARSHQAVNDAIDYVRSGKIGEVRLARGLCYKRRDSIGPRGNYEVPPSVDYSLWLGPAPEKPLTRPQFHYDWHWQWDYGNGDLGNQGIHQMDIARWGLGVDHIGRGVVSYGGRLGYEDAGETANTQISIHDFGDKRLIFEVRGLPTEPYRGAMVGVVFHGTEGYVVIPSKYSTATAFDLDGQAVKTFTGGGDHYANFVTAVRSRSVDDLNADILEGHLSSALCHLGNISYRMGDPLAHAEIEKRLEGDDDALETLERVSRHLADNDVDPASTKLRFGQHLHVNGRAETFTGELADKANQMLSRKYREPFVVPDAKSFA